MNTPVLTGALFNSVQVAYVRNHDMCVIVGANTSAMAHRKSPSQYVRYVNEGLPRGTRNESKNKGFIKRGIEAWSNALQLREGADVPNYDIY